MIAESAVAVIKAYQIITAVTTAKCLCVLTG